MIEKLEDIINTLGYFENKRIICAFDWDNTISLRNGCNFPLRDGQNTVQVMEILNDINVMWFVLTSRYAGMDVNTPSIQKLIPSSYDKIKLFNNCIKAGIDQKYTVLPPLKVQAQKGYKGLNPPDVVSIKLRTENNLEDTALIYGNVVYSGSSKGQSNKGKALIKLMANGILPTAMMFDFFIFVDNDMDHINSVIDEFNKAGLENKIVPIYYPQEPLLMMDDSCDLNFRLDECLMSK